MCGFLAPQMSSLKTQYDPDDPTKYLLTDPSMPIPSMILLEGNGISEEEIVKEIPMDWESRKYIHVTANNIRKTYEGEKEIVKTIKFPMNRCEKDEMNSEYEKQFYEERMKKSYYYCAGKGVYI